MKSAKFLVILTLFLILLLGFLSLKDNRLQETAPSSEDSSNFEITQNSDMENCTPTFRGGGGPNYLPNVPFREKIVPDDAGGERLIISGKILMNDCVTPVSGAVLDVWQANAQGEYEDEWYRGRVRADEEGNYQFETVIPQGYGSGTGYRPPHIHFKVFQDERELITSQMFFPEAQGREGFDDAYIMEIERQEEDGVTINYGYHDIILP